MHPNEWIKHVRLAAGLDQGQLADRMGATQATVSRLESGAVEATATWLSRVAKALEVEGTIYVYRTGAVDMVPQIVTSAVAPTRATTRKR